MAYSKPSISSSPLAVAYGGDILPEESEVTTGGEGASVGGNSSYMFKTKTIVNPFTTNDYSRRCDAMEVYPEHIWVCMMASAGIKDPTDFYPGLVQNYTLIDEQPLTQPSVGSGHSSELEGLKSRITALETDNKRMFDAVKNIVDQVNYLTGRLNQTASGSQRRSIGYYDET